jgi:HTH-type transcriptional regulator/antitoxin MqsA
MAGKCIDCEFCKERTRFEEETFTIEHGGNRSEVAGLSGWRCGAGGEGEFDAASARRYAAAGDELVLRDRQQQSEDIRRIRRKLGLSQVAAARLTGGGHNAFSRYERGEATSMPAVINLFRLLDRHPELLKDLVRSNSGSGKAGQRAPG